MMLKRLRRRAAVARKRVRAFLCKGTVGFRSPAERRVDLIEEARWNRAVSVSSSIAELPTLAPGQKYKFVKPRILMLQLAHMGDFVLSLRAAKKIRDGFPGSEITLVCASWNVEWSEKVGLFDEVVAFDFFTRLNKDWLGPAPDIFARFEGLPLGAYDIAVDLRHDADTRPCLYRVNAKTRVGFFAPPERGFPPLDLMLPPVELVPLPDGQEYSLHAELRFELLAGLIVSAYAEGGSHPIGEIAPTALPGVGRGYAILSVSAGDPIRRWPLQQFVELGRRLRDDLGLDLLVVGGAVEREFVAAILEALPQGAREGIDLALTDLTAKVRQASLVVGLGSGVTHLAAALGVPTICLLSGVSPLEVWRPVGPCVVNITGHTPCSPCGLKHIEDCPFGVTCLYSIPAERVMASARDLLIREGQENAYNSSLAAYKPT